MSFDETIAAASSPTFMRNLYGSGHGYNFNEMNSTLGGGASYGGSVSHGRGVNKSVVFLDQAGSKSGSRFSGISEKFLPPEGFLAQRNKLMNRDGDLQQKFNNWHVEQQAEIKRLLNEPQQEFAQMLDNANSQCTHSLALQTSNSAVSVSDKLNSNVLPTGQCTAQFLKEGREVQKGLSYILSGERALSKEQKTILKNYKVNCRDEISKQVVIQNGESLNPVMRLAVKKITGNELLDKKGFDEVDVTGQRLVIGKKLDNLGKDVKINPSDGQKVHGNFNEYINSLKVGDKVDPTKIHIESVAYHHPNSKGIKSPPPTNPTAALENAVRYSDNSPGLVGVDKVNKEIVVFYASSGNASNNKYHAFVKPWKELKQDQINVLVKKNLVTHKGKITNE